MGETRARLTPPLRFLFLFLFDLDDFAAFVVPAVGADGMRQAHGAAVRACGEVPGLQGIVCAAVIPPAL